MSQYSPADPTVVDGYNYDATSAMWKGLCNDLPCDIYMRWPEYVTATLKVVIDGQPAIIQCWKGLCEDLMPKLPLLPPPFNDIEFPGGVGAEVGVYHHLPGHEGPANLVPALPAGWPPALLAAAKLWFQARALKFDLLGDPDFWWPANELVVNSGVPVSFSLVDPVRGDPLISNYSTETYWTCQWMRPLSFTRWCLSWSIRHAPTSPVDLLRLADVSKYILKFSVAGVDYIWDAAGMRVVP